MPKQKAEDALAEMRGAMQVFDTEQTDAQLARLLDLNSRSVPVQVAIIADIVATA